MLPSLSADPEDRRECAGMLIGLSVLLFYRLCSAPVGALTSTCAGLWGELLSYVFGAGFTSYIFHRSDSIHCRQHRCMLVMLLQVWRSGRVLNVMFTKR